MSIATRHALPHPCMQNLLHATAWVPQPRSEQTKITKQCCNGNHIVIMWAGEELVYVAWPHRATNLPSLPGLLGIVHCLNRPCSLHSVSLPASSSADQARHHLSKQFIGISNSNSDSTLKVKFKGFRRIRQAAMETLQAAWSCNLLHDCTAVPDSLCANCCIVILHVMIQR